MFTGPREEGEGECTNFSYHSWLGLGYKDEQSPLRNYLASYSLRIKTEEMQILLDQIFFKSFQFVDERRNGSSLFHRIHFLPRLLVFFLKS
jgi:hypothetical protein